MNLSQFESHGLKTPPQDLMPKILIGGSRLKNFQSLGCVSHAWYQACMPLLHTIRSLAMKDASKREPYFRAISISRKDAESLAVQYVQQRLEQRKKGRIESREVVKLSTAFVQLRPSKEEIATSLCNLRGLSLDHWNGLIAALHASLSTRHALMLLCYQPNASMFLDQEDLSAAKLATKARITKDRQDHHLSCKDMVAAISGFKSAETRNTIYRCWWALICAEHIAGRDASLLEVHDASWNASGMNGKIAWLKHCFQTMPDSLAVLDRLCQDTIALVANLGASAQPKNKPAIDPPGTQDLLRLLTACIQIQWKSRHIKNQTNKNIPGYVALIESIAHQSSNLLRLVSRYPEHLTAFVLAFSQQTEKRLAHLQSYEDIWFESAEVGRLKLAIKTMKDAALAGKYWPPEEFRSSVWKGR